MQKREVSMLKSLLVAAILCSFAVLWNGVETTVLADDDVASNKAATSNDDASSVAYSRQIYKVPEVRLEPSDMSVPEDWNEDLLERLIIGIRDDRYDEKLADDLFNEKYDEIIERAQQTLRRLRTEELFIARLDDVRSGLLRWAFALELKGDLDGALSVYAALYFPNSPEAIWARRRVEYSKALSNSEKGWSSYLPEFISLCELSTKAASHLSVDEALASIKKATTRFEEATGRWGRSSSYDLPGILMTDLDYGQVLELYRFRDNCAKIVNPKLHYLYGEDGKALVFLTRKSYAVFLTFMEERCAEYIKDCEKNSKPLPDSVEIGMNFLRRVAELPY